jgi:hypothetical protein
MTATRSTTAPSTSAARSGVERFLHGILTASIPATDAWTDDARLDATVPNWRFDVEGADAIRSTYAGWFAHPGRFESLRELPTTDGVVIEYLLTWEDGGVPHAGHHVHLLTLADDGRIAEDRVFCGGRWDAALLAEMEAARAGRAVDG